MAELENAELIIRVRQGWNRANRIFLQLPDEVQLSSRRKWLDEDSKSKPGKNYDYTETYEEGECL